VHLEAGVTRCHCAGKRQIALKQAMVVTSDGHFLLVGGETNVEVSPTDGELELDLSIDNH